MDTWRYTAPCNQQCRYEHGHRRSNSATHESPIKCQIRCGFTVGSPPRLALAETRTPKLKSILTPPNNLGVDVVRRISGGGTVYHDFEGEVTYSVIAKTSDLGTADITTVYTKIYGAITDALRLLGVPADFSSGDAKNCPNLTVNGKKISGSSQTITRGVVLQHGTILRSVDLPKMFQLLKLKGASCTQAADIAKRKITSIQDELGHKISPDTVANALGTRLQSNP